MKIREEVGSKCLKTIWGKWKISVGMLHRLRGDGRRWAKVFDIAKIITTYRAIIYEGLPTCLKKLAEERQIVPGQQAQRKRELITGGGANHRESSTLFKRRAGPRNQELPSSRRTKGSAGS